MQNNWGHDWELFRACLSPVKVFSPRAFVEAKNSTAWYSCRRKAQIHLSKGKASNTFTLWFNMSDASVKSIPCVKLKSRKHKISTYRHAPVL